MQRSTRKRSGQERLYLYRRLVVADQKRWTAEVQSAPENLIKKGEHTRVENIYRPIGIPLLNNTGDIYLACA